MPRDKFLTALSAEGIPCSGGYHEQYFEGLLDEAINSRGFKGLFSADRLKAHRESFHELKGNRQVCATTVAFTQNLLLAAREGINHIIEAVRKIQSHSATLAKNARDSDNHGQNKEGAMSGLFWLAPGGPSWHNGADGAGHGVYFGT